MIDLCGRKELPKLLSIWNEFYRIVKVLHFEAYFFTLKYQGGKLREHVPLSVIKSIDLSHLFWDCCFCWIIIFFLSIRKKIFYMPPHISWVFLWCHFVVFVASLTLSNGLTFQKFVVLSGHYFNEGEPWAAHIVAQQAMCVFLITVAEIRSKGNVLQNLETAVTAENLSGREPLQEAECWTAPQAWSPLLLYWV